MTTTAAIGSGATFAVEATAGGGSYTTVGEVTDISPPASSVDAIDATHMASGDFREFVPGLIDPGEVSIEMNLTASSASDDLLHAWLEARENRSCRITWPNAVTWTFQAFPTSYSSTLPMDDKQTASLTAKVSGSVTRS